MQSKKETQEMCLLRATAFKEILRFIGDKRSKHSDNLITRKQEQFAIICY